MTTRNLGLDSEIATINAIAELEGWAVFAVGHLPTGYEIQRDDDSPEFGDDAAALAHVNRLAIAGSYLHKRAIEIHQEYRREPEPGPTDTDIERAVAGVIQECRDVLFGAESDAYAVKRVLGTLESDVVQAFINKYPTR